MGKHTIVLITIVRIIRVVPTSEGQIIQVLLYVFQIISPLFTCPVSPALVVVKLTSVITEAASGGISGLGLRVVRNKRKFSL